MSNEIKFGDVFWDMDTHVPIVLINVDQSDKKGHFIRIVDNTIEDNVVRQTLRLGSDYKYVGNIKDLLNNISKTLVQQIIND